MTFRSDMKLQFPNNGFKVVPDNYGATIKSYNGYKVAVINNTHFVHFTEWSYDQFCKDASYCDYTDMLPEGIKETPIHTNESLLAFCFYYKHLWESIEQSIENRQREIDKLKKLAE